jgi:hypothetical protein
MSDDRMDDEAAVSRRDFGVMSLGAGMAAFAGTEAQAAALQVVESDVTIKTADGTCDAAYIHPATGAHAAVLIWPDAFGLRPSMRGFARRLAAEGYSVLVPNPFYRVAKAPVFDDPTKFDFANPADMAKLGPLTGSINAAATPSAMPLPISRFSTRRRKSTRTRRSAPRATAWVAHWWSRRQHLPIALAQAVRSTAVVW